MKTVSRQTHFFLERKLVPVLLPIVLVCWLITHFNLWSLFALWAFAVFGANQLSIFGHRAWTHRAWRPNKFLNTVGLFTHVICLDGVPFAWCGTHRKHHRFSDTEQDPHSPRYRSNLSMIFAPHAVVESSYYTDLLKDPSQRWFSKYYWNIVAVWYFLLFVISPELLFFWIAGQAAHRYELYTALIYNHRDANYTKSSNTISMAYVFLNGENWHANHHEDPRDWNFSKKWWQLDMGAWLIRFFVWAKLGKLTPRSV